MEAASQRPRALLLRALGLGDFLTAVPAYRALRSALPGYEMVLAAPGSLRPLLPPSGALDQLLPCAELAPVPWVGPPPELAVNLHGSGPQSHLLLRALRPRRLLSFAHPDVPAVPGPPWDDAEHEVRRWCRLLASAGFQADPTDLLIARGEPPPPPSVPPAVLVHPGAAAVARRWPAERFAAVAGELAAEGWPVRVTGSAAEAGLAAAVAGAAGLHGDAVLAGRTSLGALTSLVAGAALVICGDTGIAHLATALRTRSVLLFGPTAPERWGPLRDLDLHTVLWAGREGDPHADRTDPGLLEIGVPEVLAAALAHLSAALPPGAEVPGLAADAGGTGPA
jgi:ADP-heptose:LPS heptosyltransferase